ncbi:MAG: hypothetical protein R6V57_07955 [Vicinamibacterales bacterium]
MELSKSRSGLGRLYFRVPFRVLTEDEEKLLSKNYKDISKQVEEAFKKR